MKLEDFVVSLKLSQRLKELGVNQDSMCHWLHIPRKSVKNNNTGDWFVRHESYKVIPWIKTKGTVKQESLTSAFNSQEIGELLPFGSLFKQKINKTNWWRRAELNFKKTRDGWFVRYENPDTKIASVKFSDKRECDARAKALIYLLENNLV